MTIEFEFSDEKGFDFSRAFADRFNLGIDQDKVAIPEMPGAGYIKEVNLNDGVGLCLHQYCLKTNIFPEAPCIFTWLNAYY